MQRNKEGGRQRAPKGSERRKISPGTAPDLQLSNQGVHMDRTRKGRARTRSEGEVACYKLMYGNSTGDRHVVRRVAQVSCGSGENGQP
ncbi:unnamed protein product [Gadus morhua 'NCC']